MTVSRQEVITTVLFHLRRYQQYPHSYVAPFPHELFCVITFLVGINTLADDVLDMRVPRRVLYEQAASLRGWADDTSRGVWHIMLDQEMPHTTIITELINLEIDVWEQCLASLSTT